MPRRKGEGNTTSKKATRRKRGVKVQITEQQLLSKYLAEVTRKHEATSATLQNLEREYPPERDMPSHTSSAMYRLQGEIGQLSKDIEILEQLIGGNETPTYKGMHVKGTYLGNLRARSLRFHKSKIR